MGLRVCGGFGWLCDGPVHMHDGFGWVCDGSVSVYDGSVQVCDGSVGAQCICARV